MRDQEKVRKSVSEAYARAVTTEAGCGGGEASKGVAARIAGYTRPELEALPADAVVNSFGCGNPVAFSGIREGETVVDLGSGAGMDLLLAGRKTGPTGRVIGVDMTDEMIARARENIAHSGLRHVEVRKGIIEALPVESGTVDWVISNCVINLSPEKPKVFAEIARVLKPGGRMLVSDIVAENLPSWVLEDPAMYASCISGAISEKDYVSGLRKAGLTDVEVRHRLVFAADQVERLVESDLLAGDADAGPAGSTCCGGPSPRSLASRLSGETAWKVASVSFFARKEG
ncbi:MAG TPA: arsenite methyltransferase [Candidatus Saccharimonadales bacterium]|nr:arsenite methyltransferase [Candidatus Saccharimonadales bacterium]